MAVDFAPNYGAKLLKVEQWEDLFNNISSDHFPWGNNMNLIPTYYG